MGQRRERGDRLGSVPPGDLEPDEIVGRMLKAESEMVEEAEQAEGAEWIEILAIDTREAQRKSAKRGKRRKRDRFDELHLQTLEEYLKE